MKKQICLIILLLVCEICNGQNLVQNYSFENITSCPMFGGLIDHAYPWRRPPNTTGTPDLYNACNPGLYGVPVNSVGYQNAQTGWGYAGIFTFGGANCREYIQVPLSSQLIPGVVYKVEMYVSPADIPGIAIGAIGIYISGGPVTGNGTYFPLPLVPQISNPANNILSDTSAWTLISGYYTASGGEYLLTIGNFLYDFQTPNLVLNSLNWGQSYYLIDDVSVSAATGIHKYNEAESVSIYPNPFSEKINIAASNHELSEIILYDITSKKLLQQTFIGSTSLNTSPLSKGIYLYEVRDKNGVIKKGMVVKE